jgi:hypothetical protein
LKTKAAPPGTNQAARQKEAYNAMIRNSQSASNRATKFKSVSAANPCAICWGNHKCSRGEDGLFVCGRKSGHVFGFVYLGQAKKDDQFALYRREGDPLLNSDAKRNGHHAKHWSGKATNGQAVNWTAKAEGFRQALTPERRGELAQALSLPEHVLVSLNHLGFSPKGFHMDYFDKPCWTFPEVDAAGHVIGINCRYADGAKKVMSGGHRGLTVPDGWRDRPGLVLCPEGPSDTLAATALGLAAIGRPNDKGGIELLAGLFHDLPPNRQIIILGEYDPKPDGRWPGRDGAMKVANELAERLQRAVDWALPPGTVKDLRRWVNQRQMDPACTDEWQAAGAALWTELKLQEAKATPGEPDLPAETPWPEPLAVEAFHGLAGEIVRTIEPTSEADPAALLVQTLVAFGNVVGRNAHFTVEGDRHHGNEFVVLVGRSSKARKGTSWGRIFRLFEEVEPQWATERVQSGLSSGEGLIWAVRDPIQKRERVKERDKAAYYEEVESDPGVADKRLLIYEPEFANVLKQTERQGNTLSAILRQAWDGTKIQTLVKNNPARATAAHIGLIGHVTADELRRYLTQTEAANGYANRHLWICADRSKLLPEGGKVDPATWNQLRNELANAIAFARAASEITRNEEARAIWHKVYGPLSEGRPGLAGALLARGEAHVMRLALLYALLDRSTVIEAPHLLAALALWEYVERSVYFVFGDSLGDPVADDLLQLLRRCKGGLTRNEIRDYFQRNVSADRIGRALGLLLQHRLARCVREETGGRPAERWYAGREG